MWHGTCMSACWGHSSIWQHPGGFLNPGCWFPPGWQCRCWQCPSASAATHCSRCLPVYCPVCRLKGSPTEGQQSVFTGRHRVVNRGMLAAALVQLCQEQYSGSVAFHFNRALHSLNSYKCIAAFTEAAGGSSSSSRNGQRQLAAVEAAASGVAAGEEPADPAAPAAAAAAAGASAATATGAPSGGLETVSFDLLVGADGSGSRVREEVARQDSKLRYSQQADVMEFKTFVLGPASDFLPAGASAAGSFQTWNNSKARLALRCCSAGAGVLCCFWAGDAVQLCSFVP